MMHTLLGSLARVAWYSTMQSGVQGPFQVSGKSFGGGLRKREWVGGWVRRLILLCRPADTIFEERTCTALSRSRSPGRRKRQSKPK